MLLHRKETVTRVEIQTTEQKNFFANYTSNKGLYLGYLKDLKNKKQKKIKHTQKHFFLVNKWAKEPDRQFSKQGTQMTNTFLKKCSISLNIRKMQAKGVLRLHLTPITKPLPTNTGKHTGNKTPCQC